MKFKLIISFLFLSVTFLEAQTGNSALPNEFSTSINRTCVKNKNTENRIGFGIGFYRSDSISKRANLIVGLEYNRVIQFKKTIYENSKFGGVYSNMTYRFNYLTIISLIRLHVGHKYSLIIEAGPYIDIPPYSSIEGTREYQGKTKEINEEGLLGRPTFGISSGIGISFPFKKFDLMLKPQYKYGLNYMKDENNEIFYNRYFAINLTMGMKY
jgi:hypothetical protein